MTRLVLASKSAIRAEILRRAGVPFEAVGAGVHEGEVKQRLLNEGRGPREIAQALAEAKALSTNAGADALVLGADQTLEFEGGLIDKAADAEEARERLRAFRGREHRLHAGLALASAGAVVWQETTTSTLRVRAFSDAFLDDYVRRAGEALTRSVGAYEYEGLGAQLFERAEGDYFAILGLPLLGLLGALRDRGVLAS